MKKVLFALVIAAVLVACQKESAPAPAPSPTGRLEVNAQGIPIDGSGKPMAAGPLCPHPKLAGYHTFLGIKWPYYTCN